MPRSDFYEQAEAIARRIDQVLPEVVVIQPEAPSQPAKSTVRRRNAQLPVGPAALPPAFMP